MVILVKQCSHKHLVYFYVRVTIETTVTPEDSNRSFSVSIPMGGSEGFLVIDLTFYAGRDDN